MQITRDGSVWGRMQVTEQGTQVQFHATGTLPQYGEILRVWGMRDGCQPLLIGVAEPAGAGLTVDRTMSRQYLSSLGYDMLPEYYTAGIQPPRTENQSVRDPLLVQAMQQESVTMRKREDMLSLSCPFSADTAFPLAFIFSCCTVKNGTATLLWDRKKGCPCIDSPDTGLDSIT